MITTFVNQSVIEKTLIIRISNMCSSTVLTLLIYFFYSKNHFFLQWVAKDTLFELPNHSIHFNTQMLFKPLFIIYIVVFNLIYILEKLPELSKSIYFFHGVYQLIKSPIQVFNEGLPKTHKMAILSVLVKAYFAPMMIFGLCLNLASSCHLITVILNQCHRDNCFFNPFERHINLNALLLNWLFFIDLLYFSIGYVVEHKSLKNQILSVEPTLFGWIIALACYTPFNSITGIGLPWPSNNIVSLPNEALEFLLNIIIFILFSIYVAASIALGLKASNLTHRGIVEHGVYRYIRHPAYAAKVSAWLLGSIPFLYAASSKGSITLLLTLLPMLGWSAIYFFRALTEERHLRGVNKDYDLYMKKVPYRFIPRVI